MQQEVTLSKKSCSTFGILSVVAWNVFLGILVWAARVPLENVLANDRLKLIGVGALLIIWSVVWYFIGYQYRKKYMTKREYYRAELPKKDRKNFNEVFFKYHLSKNTKAISTVLFITIPWYIIGQVQGNTLKGNDYMVVGVLLLISAVLYGVHKKYRDTL